MTQRILIMGLPGSGKTTLANALVKCLRSDAITVGHLNADEIRKQFNDWDFSEEGRIRQSKRMRALADDCTFDYVIADFVAPLQEMRTIFDPHWIVWLDTVKEGRFEDTNKMFEEPTDYNYRLITQDADKWAAYISPQILGIS